YKYLEKYQGIKTTDHITHGYYDSVITRITDTIYYYTDLNDKPRIDCYTQVVDKFNINNAEKETEIISNPYYKTFEQNTVADSSLLSIDNILSNYIKNVESVLDAFTGSNAVMGGDGTYIRLLEGGYIKKNAPPIDESKILTFTEFSAEFYRANAMACMDYIQTGLITDIYYDYLASKLEGFSYKEIMKAWIPLSDGTRKGNKKLLFKNFLKNTYTKYLSYSFRGNFKRNLDHKNNDLTNNILKDIEAMNLEDAQEILYNNVKEYFKTHEHLGPALKEKMFVILDHTISTKIYYLDKDPLKGSRIIRGDGDIDIKLLKSIITKLRGDTTGKKIIWPTKDTLDTSKKIFSNDISLIQLIYNSYGQNGLDTVRKTLELFWDNASKDTKSIYGRFYLRLNDITHQNLIDATTILGIVEKLNDYSSTGNLKKSTITDLRAIVITVEEKSPGIFKVEIKDKKQPTITKALSEKLQKLHYLVPEALVYGGEVPEIFNQLNRAIDNFNKPYEQQHRFTSKYDKGPYEVKKNQNKFMHRIIGFINFWAKGGMFDNSKK
ncbi:unnamed protein product, partial [marine sediment metagenome]